MNSDFGSDIFDDGPSPASREAARPDPATADSGPAPTGEDERKPTRSRSRRRKAEDAPEAATEAPEAAAAAPEDAGERDASPGDPTSDDADAPAGKRRRKRSRSRRKGGARDADEAHAEADDTDHAIAADPADGDEPRAADALDSGPDEDQADSSGEEREPRGRGRRGRGRGERGERNDRDREERNDRNDRDRGDRDRGDRDRGDRDRNDRGDREPRGRKGRDDRGRRKERSGANRRPRDEDRSRDQGGELPARQRIAILLDAAELQASTPDKEISFGHLRRHVARSRVPIRAIAYYSAKQKALGMSLAHAGFEATVVESKSVTNIAIAVDAMALADRVDCVILVPGHNSLSHLAKTLRARGVRVESASFKEEGESKLGAQDHVTVGGESCFVV